MLMSLLDLVLFYDVLKCPILFVNGDSFSSSVKLKKDLENFDDIGEGLLFFPYQSHTKLNYLHSTKIKECDLNIAQILPFVEKIYPSDANFLLVKTTDGRKIYNYLIERHQVIVL